MADQKKMFARRNRMASRERESRSRSRSRSVTSAPVERGPSKNSAAGRAVLMRLIDGNQRPNPELSPSPPPRSVHVFPMVSTPGGSTHMQDDAVPMKQTPGSRIRRIQSMPAVPLFFDAVERVEALDMSEEEAEELMEEAPWHLRRWVQSKSPVALRPSVTSDVTHDHSEVDVRPSTSGLTASAGRVSRYECGSDLDSDYDEEFDALETMPKSHNNIPEMEELEEPMFRPFNAKCTWSSICWAKCDFSWDWATFSPTSYRMLALPRDQSLYSLRAAHTHSQ